MPSRVAHVMQKKPVEHLHSRVSRPGVCCGHILSSIHHDSVAAVFICRRRHARWSCDGWSSSAPAAFHAAAESALRGRPVNYQFITTRPDAPRNKSRCAICPSVAAGSAAIVTVDASARRGNEGQMLGEIGDGYRLD